MLIALIVVSTGSGLAFAETEIQVNVSQENIGPFDSVIITGTITDVADYKPVTILVVAPDGTVVYSPFVSIQGDGEFKRLLHPTLPSFQTGTYTVTVSHEDTEITAQTQFTVIGSGNIPDNRLIQGIAGDLEINPTQETLDERRGGMTILAEAVNGSDTIIITGNTSLNEMDVTLIASSPAGNIVTIAQIIPDTNGDFKIELKVGSPLWEQDGIYTITANQGKALEYRETVQVEIRDGVVVPEFGVVASLILVVSIIAVILVSTRSKLVLSPRY